MKTSTSFFGLGLALAMLLTGSALAILDLDNNGSSDIWEEHYNATLPANEDPDGDGFTNQQEYDRGTHPLVKDSSEESITIVTDPKDGLQSQFRFFGGIARTFKIEETTDLADTPWSEAGTVPGADTTILMEENLNSDKKFFRMDPQGADPDGEPAGEEDNLDGVEEHFLGSDNTKGDSDGDGMFDFYEASYRDTLDITTDDASQDPDNDGLLNLEEFLTNTNPGNSDSDNDGISDGGEVDQGNDPNNPTNTPTAEWFILTGDLEEDVEKRRSRTVSVPSGEHRLLVLMVTSDEYLGPDADLIDYRYIDTLSWNIQVDGIDPIQDTIDIVSRHFEWVEAENLGFSAQGFSPVHVEAIEFVEAPDDTDLEITMELAATNIGDHQIPSTVLVGLLPCELSVDANRDGEIEIGSSSDKTEEDKPYRFWVNDDEDSEENDEDPAGTPDHSNNTIDTKRDLEDFTRLHIHLGGLHDGFKNGNMKLGLKWRNTTGSPAVKVYQAVESDGRRLYLEDDTVAGNQISNGYETAKAEVSGTTAVLLQNLDLSSLSESSPDIYLIFEAAAEGEGDLALTIHDSSGAEIGEGPGVWLNLQDIMKFYERAKATPDNPDSFTNPYDINGDDGDVPQPTMGWVQDPNGHPFEAYPDEEKTYIIFVHGWNTSYNGFLNGTETFYKRLWHAGYKGRVAGFRWPTYEGLTTYNRSDYRAWHSGESLKQFIGSLPGGYTRNVAAHSMGNIVAGSALSSAGAPAINNYAAMQAAVPAMCYDGTVVDFASKNTPDNDSSEYIRLVFGFKNRFSSINGNVINMFLTNDPDTGNNWRINNNLFKPDIDYDYSYTPTAIQSEKLKINFTIRPDRYLNDLDTIEALTFVTASRSETLGVTSSLDGSVDTPKNLKDFGFEDFPNNIRHSGQFKMNIQETTDFYLEMFDLMSN